MAQSEEIETKERAMVATLSRQMNLETFLARQDDTETRYELEDGELLAMPPESDLNRRIAIFLLIYFANLGIAPNRLSQKTEVVVPGSKQTVRIPDLMVLSEAAAIALENATRSTIMPDMPPPELVIEVVSPGQKNIARDYRYKRAQYQARGIEEYWIVDPLTEQITVLIMNEGLYDEAVFTKDQAIASAFLNQNQAKTPLQTAEILQIRPAS